MIKKTQLTLKYYEHKNNRHWVASGLTALGVTVLAISPLVTTTASVLQPTTVFATDNARDLTVTEQLQIARLQAAVTTYQAVANIQLRNEAGWPAQLTQAIVDAQSMIQTIQTASYLTGNRDRGGQPFGDDQVANATNRIMSYALAIQVAQIRQDDPTWYAKMTSGALASNVTYDPLTSIAFGAQDGFPWMQGMLQQILAVYADNVANDVVNSDAPVTSSAADASDVTSSSAVNESNTTVSATPEGPSSSEVSDSTVSSSAADTSSIVAAPSVSATPELSSSDSAVDSASSTTADSNVSSSAVDTSVSAVTPSASVAPDMSDSVSAGISSNVTDTAVSTATSSVSVDSETSTKTSTGASTSNKTASADSSSAANLSVTNVSDVTVAIPSSVSSVSEAASASVTGTTSDVASATADGVNSLVANSAPVTDQVTTLQPNQVLAATTLRNTTNLANGLTTVVGGVTNVPSAPETSQVTRFLAGAASAATANNVAQAQAAYTASATANVAATAANGSVANGLDTGATVQAGTVNATNEAITHLRDTQFDTAANQLPVVASVLSTLLAGLGGLLFMLWRRRKESSVEESERVAAEDDQFFAEIDKMKDNWQ